MSLKTSLPCCIKNSTELQLKLTDILSFMRISQFFAPVLSRHISEEPTT